MFTQPPLRVPRYGASAWPSLRKIPPSTTSPSRSTMRALRGRLLTVAFCGGTEDAMQLFRSASEFVRHVRNDEREHGHRRDAALHFQRVELVHRVGVCVVKP